MKPKELINYIPTEQEIKNAMDGYFSLTPSENNKYFEHFEKNWLRFQKDIEHYNNGNHGDSYLLIMQAGKDHRIALYERCSLKLQEIRNTFSHATEYFEKNLSTLNENDASQLLKILEIWKIIESNDSYALNFEFTRECLSHPKFKEVELERPHGSYSNFINECLSTIEKCIDELCTLFAQHLGISCAMICLLEQGSFPSCKDFVTRDRNCLEFSLEQHRNKSLRNLLNMGHLVDTAVKLRFISLVDKDRYSHQESYGIIESELNELGLCPKDFPDEPKTLADRARRHRDKIFAELNSFSENNTL